jgi:hypothetical protein
MGVWRSVKPATIQHHGPAGPGHLAGTAFALNFYNALLFAIALYLFPRASHGQQDIRKAEFNGEFATLTKVAPLDGFQFSSAFGTASSRVVGGSKRFAVSVRC